MGLKYKLAVPNGTYQKDGQTKTSWLNIGAIMTTKKGGFVMKLDAIPTNVVDQEGNSVPFNGWVNMFEHEGNSKPAHSNPTGGVAVEPAPLEMDDIPFIDPYKFNSLMV